ncbi:Crp/Fnr family transcriptional regulator [Paenibacillus tyrfis]|uniref:Crp/Fnr family transcriptional regulator n=1 Tax=Paenibacillus tyrfis TaxID=1501230 RepID=UPI00209DA7E3|nr:Crp/Fnr family transcriptional regulator [Paenibacillus tyrfis]MCP1308053.1 Crp/Fnr family transcriptional regulator [Paenibacillus tyrfis]
MQKHQIEDVITRFPFLADISPEEWKEEGISIVSLPVNSVVYEGEFLKSTALILEGSIRIYKLSDSGREVTLFRISNGECSPLMAAGILGRSEFEAWACFEKPTTILIVPIQISQEWMDKYKGFRQFILRSFAFHLNNLSNLIETMNFKSIRTRISKYLIEKTSNDNDSLAITHDILAIELGTVREVISRTLKSMEKEGLLRLERGQITHIQHRKLLVLLNKDCREHTVTD